MIVDVLEPNGHKVVYSDVCGVSVHDDCSFHITYYAGSQKYLTCSFFACEDYESFCIRKE